MLKEFGQAFCYDLTKDAARVYNNCTTILMKPSQKAVVKSLNVMISGYVGFKSVEVYDQMVSVGEKPETTVTSTCLLASSFITDRQADSIIFPLARAGSKQRSCC